MRGQRLEGYTGDEEALGRAHGPEREHPDQLSVLARGRVRVRGRAVAELHRASAPQRWRRMTRLSDRELTEHLNGLQALLTKIRRDSEVLIQRVRQQGSEPLMERLLGTLGGLDDAVFPLEVEQMVLTERLTLESAVQKILSEGDRVRRLTR